MDELVIDGDGETVTNADTIIGDEQPAVTIIGNDNVFTNAGELRVGGDVNYATVQLSGTGNTFINDGVLVGRTALLGSDGADIFVNREERLGVLQMGAGNDIVREEGVVLATSEGVSGVNLGAGDDIYVIVSGQAQFLRPSVDGEHLPASVVAFGGEGEDTFILEVEGESLIGALELEGFETLRLNTTEVMPSLSLTGLSDFDTIILEDAFELRLSEFSNAGVALDLNGSFITLTENSAIGAVSGGDANERIDLIGEARADSISLGAGDDQLVLDGGTVADTIDGGAGFDTLVASLPAGEEDVSRYTNFERLNFLRTEQGTITLAGASATAERIDLIATSTVLEGISTAAQAGLAIYTLGGTLRLMEDTTVASIDILQNDLTPGAVGLQVEGRVTGDITLGATNDLVVNSGRVDGQIDLGDGNDTYRDAGADVTNTVLLGEGVDRVEGDFGDLVDDSFNGFGDDDTLYLTDARYALEDFNIGRGDLFTFSRDDQSIIFTDTDVDFEDGDLIFSGNDGGTEISFLDFLPALADGQAVGAGDINGVGAQQYLNGDTASRFVISLEQASALADFKNSLGVYEVDAAGNIVDVRVIADNVKTDAGDIEVSGIDAGHQLGFFIIQKGADLFGAEVLSSDDLGIDIVDGAAVLTNGGSAVDGATIFVSHDGSLNIDGLEHVVTGASEERDSTLRMGFEDLLRDDQSTDDDFQDVIVHIEAMPDTILAATADIL